MKKTSLIFGGIALLITILWVTILAVPAYKERETQQILLSQKQAQMADYNNILGEFHEVFTRYENLLKHKESILSKLYSREDLIKLFDDIYAKGKLAQVRIVEISPPVDELIKMNKITVEDGKPLELDITVKFFGNLENSGRFIKLIEKHDYYNGLNHCNMTNQGIQGIDSHVDYGFVALLGTMRRGS